MNYLRALVLAALTGAAPLHAQIVSDGTTVTLNGVTNEILGNVVIGSDSPDTRLFLTNEALLTFSGDGIIGQSVGGDSNSVVLGGTNTRWVVGGSLYTGFGGAGNQVVVDSSARLFSFDAFIGYSNSASGNLVTVQGAGSVWTNTRTLYVGSNGAFNSLNILAGGTVISSNATIGDSSSANANTARVDGAGSRWTVLSNFFVGGLGGAGNAVIITNGGMVQSARTLLGSVGDGNRIQVTGAGSVWSNSHDLNVGFNGDSNSLFVSQGGVVTSRGISRLGRSFSISNQVVVTDSGSRWDTDALEVGFSGSFNSVVVTNGGQLTTSATSIGLLNHCDNNLLLVTGPGSSWTNFGNLSMGFYLGATGNQIVVSNGGSAVCGGVVYVGEYGQSNSVTVTGPGSRWDVPGGLIVGFLGAYNQLVISNGGVVSTPSGNVGGQLTGHSNTVTVTGAGSLWSNSIALRVGSSTVGNQLIISNSGTVWAEDALIGQNPSSAGSRVIIDGGTLRVRNQFALIRGTNVLNAGQFIVHNLNLNYPDGRFLFNGGTLSADEIAVDNGLPFRVGDGSRPALLDLTGVSYSFPNGLILAANAGISFPKGTVQASGITNTGNSFTVGDGLNEATLDLLGNTSHTFSSSLIISSNSSLVGNGTLNGDVINNGTISPGNSYGAFRINGGLILNAGSRMHFDIGNDDPTNRFDRVDVSSFVVLGGTLSVTFNSAYIPAPGDTLKLMDFTGPFGTFANAPAGARILSTDGRVSFIVSYSNGLTLSQFEYRDTDGDGQGDLQEEAAITNPEDSTSVFAITSITRNPAGHNVIRFRGYSFINYRVLYSDDTTTWNHAAGAVLTEAGFLELQFIDDGTVTGGLPGARRLYRISLP